MQNVVRWAGLSLSAWTCSACATELCAQLGRVVDFKVSVWKSHLGSCGQILTFPYTWWSCLPFWNSSTTIMLLKIHISPCFCHVFLCTLKGHPPSSVGTCFCCQQYGSLHHFYAFRLSALTLHAVLLCAHDRQLLLWVLYPSQLCSTWPVTKQTNRPSALLTVDITILLCLSTGHARVQVNGQKGEQGLSYTRRLSPGSQGGLLCASKSSRAPSHVSLLLLQDECGCEVYAAASLFKANCITTSALAPILHSPAQSLNQPACFSWVPATEVTSLLRSWQAPSPLQPGLLPSSHT